MLSIHPRPRLALTLGDPTGIGPEVILKALGDRELSQICDITIIGNRDCLHQTYGQLCSRWISGSRPPLADLEELNLLDVNLSPVDRMPLGQPSAASGAASFEFLEVAIARTLAGEFDGIVTGPIAKSAWKQAGHVYPGQTELLAERARVQRFGMLFVAESPYTQWTLRAMLATTHLPLRQVPTVLVQPCWLPNSIYWWIAYRGILALMLPESRSLASIPTVANRGSWGTKSRNG